MQPQIFIGASAPVASAVAYATRTQPRAAFFSCCNSFWQKKRWSKLVFLRHLLHSILAHFQIENRHFWPPDLAGCCKSFWRKKVVATAHYFRRIFPLGPTGATRRRRRRGARLQLGIPIGNFRLISTRTTSIDLLHSGLGVLRQVLTNGM